MSLLITGGGGFLGKNIVRALLDRGAEVRVLGRSAYPELEAWGVPCVRGDVADPEAVDRAVAGVESVFHVASRVGYWGDLSAYRTTNVEGTRLLLERARAAGVKRFVYTSTPSVVIGREGLPVGADESLPYPERYLSPYGPTKAEAERLVLAANDPASFRTVALRPHFIFGPGDPQVVPRILENARRGTLAQVGDGSNRVDVTYIDSAVAAHLQAHDALADPASPAQGQAYFIGQEAPVLLWDFVARVLEGFGAPPVKKRISFRTAWTIGATLEGVYRALPLRGEPPLTRMAAVILGTSHSFSHAKAARDFGYQPAVSVEEGLARLFAHHAGGGGAGASGAHP